MRLIDADALIESIKTTADLGGWIGEALYQIKQVAIKYIESAPTIEPKRGEWKIEETNSVWGKGYLLTCSECGDSFRVTETALPYEHFCRNCGARMKGADDE